MKNLFFALTFALSFQVNAGTTTTSTSSPSTAVKKACKAELTLDLKYCATAFRGLKGKERCSASITCVKGSMAEYKTCLATPQTNACVTACQTANTNAVAQCQATYNPALCNGYAPCITLTLADQAFCIDVQTQNLNACKEACPL